MSEVVSRPAASRGRGSGRGRGGGFSTRGGGRAVSRQSPANSEAKHDADSAMPTLEDEGEVAELKAKYGDKLAFFEEMFPEWSALDILYVLQDTDGDELETATRISSGTSKWGEVSKSKKERTRTKGKGDTFTTTTGDVAPGAARTTRGGRLGAEAGRGRGRATERGGRGGGRGKSTHAATNGTRNAETVPLSVPTKDAPEWDAPKVADEAAPCGDSTATWETPATQAETASAVAPVSVAPVATPKASVIPEGTQKTWASMLRQSTAPKPAPKPKEAPVSKPSEPVTEPVSVPEPVELDAEPPAAAEEPVPEAPKEPTPAPPTELPAVVIPDVILAPKDQLTEANLEQVPDNSHPPKTETSASEAADSWDPRAPAPSSTATPISASQHQHQQASRIPASGFAATASKATDRAANRTPNFPRRILDQLEPVRMPGNRDQVDRAAVQFGAFSLNGPIDEDIDGDREEPETRPQPPEDSPVAHPRTSLPPAAPAPVPEAFSAQKPVSSLPPTGPAAATTPTPQNNIPVAPQAPQPSAPQNGQFGRFGQPTPQEPASFPTSKPFDSFSQQQQAPAAQHQFETGFPSQGQAVQPQVQQQPGGAFSSAPSEYTSYYTADPQNRNAYNNYYNQNFAQQQGAQGQQEGLPSQGQRSFSGYTAPQADNLSQYPQSGAQHGQSRFGSGATEAQVGGAPTPTQATTQGQANQAQPHGQQQLHEYPYNSHPYYNSPYYSTFMGYQANQGTSYNQSAYGQPYGKGGLGYQPNQYGVSPQGPHGYGASPAAGFSQTTLHRDGGVSAGLGEYGRVATAQSAQQPTLGAGGFSGMHDAFGRGASAYQSQAGQSFAAAGSQPGGVPSAADDLKPFGDAKVAGGPSPSLANAVRPGSAANNGPSQTGLPPPQSNQQGLGGVGAYGGYPSQLPGHALHGNQSGAAGYSVSATGAQTHQNSYGGYGGQGFASYYGNPPRGWGNNYNNGQH
ncbi:hypothetical protein B0T26DRAFT_673760 [Lasiosphaeria miniovina]|uniref:CUE domain-containing protein n=1 Tax=Lasiosphaeria miniovina TaxID=1954250 RepID=A0AA40AU31_9PEZI|nr:uncharacterized protein B0T26DRAFT_673760 [Lasiosphaeria miniovina]KAK0722004.1 hypothetical protein B0T26DRAFT_673760 [Lasiosphaeria miniovina]